MYFIFIYVKNTRIWTYSIFGSKILSNADVTNFGSTEREQICSCGVEACANTTSRHESNFVEHR